MPILVQDVKAFDPDLIAFSSDIADIGTPDRLGCFRQIMRPIDVAGIPWYDSPGNHDRVAIAGPGGVANGSIEIWRDVFSDMPAPWGDGKPPVGVTVPEGEDDDGEGAATHYFLDYGPKGDPAFRLIVLDNSQHSLTTSDIDQYPAVGPGAKDASQLAFLQRAAADADAQGLASLVLMHQPTQDPRDLSNVHPTSLNHTMGKGLSPDNRAFDLLASQNGVDAVLLGHIQGNVEYTFGDTDYFIDGGGGGTPYARHEVGTDTGYYYGFRVLRFFQTGEGWDFRTYFVPLVDKLELTSPESITVGDEAEFAAAAIQPFDADLPPRLGGAANEAIRLELRAPDAARMDRATVPELAYMWKVSDPSILKPIAGELDPTGEPKFNADSMTTSGRFEALRPGTVKVTIMTGTHKRTVLVSVLPAS